MSGGDSSGPGGIKPMFINPTKKYGLIINKPAQEKAAAALPSSLAESLRQKKPLGAKPCIFDDDDEDDDAAVEEKTAKSGKAGPLLHGKLNAGVSSHMKKKTQIEIEKALAEDANVFEYDAVYDEVERQKGKLDPAKARQNESKEPKYMAGLMKAAAKRRMDFEKLQEKKVQKEREAEGDLWADKEVFVTSAYRQKLEERQRLEEEERRQEQLESLLDVRRQKDLSGFYTSMLKIRSGEMVIEEESEKEKRIEREMRQARDKAAAVKTGTKQFRAKRDESESEEEAEAEEEPEQETATATKEEKDESSGDQEARHEDQEQQPEFKKPKLETKEQEDQENKAPAPTTDAEQEKKPEEEKPLLSKEERRELRRKQLFTKRTVGDKFDAELAEYFVRKATLLSLKSYIERE